MVVFNGLFESKHLFDPALIFTFLCNLQVDRPIQAGIAALVGAA